MLAANADFTEVNIAIIASPKRFCAVNEEKNLSYVYITIMILHYWDYPLG
jgi:hypothetical protein